MINNVLNYLTSAYQINPFWQIFGFIAFILWMIAFLNKNDKLTKNIHWFSLFFRVVHYYIFWLYTWVLCDLIGWFRNFFSLKDKWKKYIFIFFIIIYLLSWYLTYYDTISLLPVISWILATIAYFYLKWIKMRLVLLITPILWIFYDLKWNSIWWIITDVFYTAAHIITISRLIIDKKSTKFCDK